VKVRWFRWFELKSGSSAVEVLVQQVFFVGWAMRANYLCNGPATSRGPAHILSGTQIEGQFLEQRSFFFQC
jgi:hypothetical protein